MPKDHPDPDVAHRLELWDALRPVDPRFTKPITGKSYKGDSPNPTYVIRKLTEQLGPIGVLWGFRVVRETIIEGAPHQIESFRRAEMAADGQTVITKEVRYETIREKYHQVEIEFWQHVDGELRSFSAFGGTPMLYRAKSGNWIMDEDAAKKSLTDAYTKAASWLGACADIFLGLFDDKYQAPKAATIGDPQPAFTDPDAMPDGPARDPSADLPPATPPAKRQSSAPAGW